MDAVDYLTARESFLALRTKRELASLLSISLGDLDELIRRIPAPERYRRFKIPKKNGTPRAIEVPIDDLLLLQRKLSRVLNSAYFRKGATHGFVPGGSILTNAVPHLNRRYVLNIDLKDFFGSIGFNRVRHAFQKVPYSLPDEVAITLAQICCHSDHLPQGAPTSPIVSNIVCAPLDSKLRRVAHKYKCVYSRYADDLTFSTNASVFPTELIKRRKSMGRGDQRLVGKEILEVAPEIQSILFRNGFRVHESKVRLRSKSDRQLVTGVVVNGTSPRVPREVHRNIRAMLHTWEHQGYDTAKQRYMKFRPKTEFRLRPPASLVEYIRGKLSFISMIHGSDDDMYQRYLTQLNWLETRDGLS